MTGCQWATSGARARDCWNGNHGCLREKRTVNHRVIEQAPGNGHALKHGGLSGAAELVSASPTRCVDGPASPQRPTTTARHTLRPKTGNFTEHRRRRSPWRIWPRLPRTRPMAEIHGDWRRSEHPGPHSPQPLKKSRKHRRRQFVKFAEEGDEEVNNPRRARPSSCFYFRPKNQTAKETA
jgi:hypothetical protein